MKYGAIAGGEKSTVQTAFEILKNGGNAFDAAVGAVFTSMVSEFNLTGPGGGGAFLAGPVNAVVAVGKGAPEAAKIVFQRFGGGWCRGHNLEPIPG